MRIPSPPRRDPPASDAFSVRGEPPEIQAFVEHSGQDLLVTHDLLRLARELAVEPAPPSPVRVGLRWALGGAVAMAAAAGLLWCLDRPTTVAPPEPAQAENEPAKKAVPVVSLPLPSPAPPEQPAVAGRAPRIVPPAPMPEPVSPSSDPVVELAFTALAPQTVNITPHIRAEVLGAIQVTGTQRSPDLVLQGRAEIDVTPGTVDDFVLHTDAAVIRVIGTRFSVETTDGTAVRVSRGRVGVVCLAGVPQPGGLFLDAGADVTCPTPTPSGMLVYAQRLRDQGASPSAVLDAAEAGLRMRAEQPALRDALQVIRIQALLAVGRHDEAAAEARTYLASGATVLLDEVRVVEAATRSPGERRSPAGAP